MDYKNLFLQFLKDERDIASKKGSKAAIVYQKAYDSLSSYNEGVDDLKTMRSIKFIGDSTVRKLLSKLAIYCQENSIEYPEPFVVSQAPGKRNSTELEVSNPSKRKKRVYVPGKRSGGYAILLALYKVDIDRNGLTQDELIKVATPFCDRSFKSNPGANQFYSAWSAIKQLEKHDLVKVSGRPKRYYLTEDGQALAYKLKNCEGLDTPKKSGSNGVSQNEINTTNSPSFEDIPYETWGSEDFEIILVIDSREVRSKTERDFFQERLIALGVKCEVAPLSVGDGIWVAQHKSNGEKVVLNFIFERKRIDDLAFSIRDGRFSEQKNRLKLAAMKYTYYIVEEFAGDLPLPGESVQTAISSTLISSNFFLRKFKTVEETLGFLANLTKIVQEFYSNKKLLVLKPRDFKNSAEYAPILNKFRAKFESGNDNLMECVYPIETFMTMLSKSMVTVGETFIKMLMCTKGVSLEKAQSIQKMFATASKLIEYYQQNSDKDENTQKYLLSEMFKNHVSNRKIGPSVSEKLWETWGQ